MLQAQITDQAQWLQLSGILGGAMGRCWFNLARSNWSRMAIDPEMPGSSNTIGSRMNMQQYPARY